VKIQLKEASAEAQVKADLKKAEGDLKVKEAEKLVQLKEAEAIGESIDIIKKKLAGSPEYLMWHQIKVMGQAAMSPNNCFILYPYATDSSQVRGMLNNASLVQMLKPEGPNPEMKTSNEPMPEINGLGNLSQKAEKAEK
jgi:regulator of protease activity HflC (stomatin/prohibitin superfamily)